MSDVNEEFCRIYFEDLNFLVRTNVKYYITSEKGIGGDSDIDLVVINLKPDRLNPPKNFVLSSDELKGIEHAAIEIKGWHENSFTPTLIKTSPRIFYFVRPEAIEKAKEVLQTANFKKILIISSFGSREESKKQAIQMLKKGGIDYVIEFKTIFDSVFGNVKENKNYDSEILQTIRLAKKY